jgi:hypothetical protein
MSYARAAQKDLRMATACNGYLKVHVSKEKFVNIQQVIGGLVDELPEEGFTPRLINTYWARGAAILVARTSRTRIGWVVRYQRLRHGRLKMVDLEAPPTYTRVVAWFLGSMEDMEHYFQRLCRLNQGMNTDNWRVNEYKEKSNRVCLVLSIDSSTITALEWIRW